MNGNRLLGNTYVFPSSRQFWLYIAMFIEIPTSGSTIFILNQTMFLG